MNLKQRAGMVGLALFLPLVVGMAVACGSASQPPPAAEKAAPMAAPVAPAQPAQPSDQESAVKDTPTELESQSPPAAEKSAPTAAQVAPVQPADRESAVKNTPEPSASPPPPAAEKAAPTAAQADPAQPADQESAVKDTPAPPVEIPIANTSPYDDAASCEPDGDLLCTDWGPPTRHYAYEVLARNAARRNQLGIGDQTDRTVNWETQEITIMPGNIITGTASPSAAEWLAMAEVAATAACREQGAQYAAGSAYFGPGHSYDLGSGENDTGPRLGWFFERIPFDRSANVYQYRARQSRTWAGVCRKTGN